MSVIPPVNETFGHLDRRRLNAIGFRCDRKVLAGPQLNPSFTLGASRCTNPCCNREMPSRMGERQVDLPQLFSDVSKTISGISSIMGSAPIQDDEGTSNGGGGGMSGLFGNTCFKACGMEDIQFAARSAGDMLISLRVCLIILTIVIATSIVLLTASALYLVCRRVPPRRLFPLPSFVRDVFQPKDGGQTIKEDNHT